MEDRYVNDANSGNSGFSRVAISLSETGSARTVKTKKTRRKDLDLCRFAREFPLENFGSCRGCCTITDISRRGRCMDVVSLGPLKLMRSNLWGSGTADAVTTSQRKLKMLALLNQAFRPTDKTFLFKIGDTEICESAFLQLLGISMGSNVSGATAQWKELKAALVSGNSDSIDRDRRRQKVITRREKQIHAKAFIQCMADLYADTSPLKGMGDLQSLRAPGYDHLFHHCIS